MNRVLWLAAILSVLCLAARLPAAPATQPTTAEQWGVYEITLKGPTDGNPFDNRFSAVFDNGEKKIDVPGFYDGDGIYRVRFMPELQGKWHYETKSSRWELTGKLGDFTVTPPSKGNHGPVRVHNTFHFAYADGTPYNEIGTTIYNWIDTPEELQDETLKTLADAPFNKARMLLTQQPEPYAKQFKPAMWPFEGKPPHDWDLTRFNTDYWKHYEKRIGQLRDLGVEADLIIFNPYGKWGFERMDAAGDERYVRYVVARLSAYRNVWWSLCNEWDFLRVKSESDWDRIGSLVQQVDPYNHLRSIHNGALMYDNRKAWVTHASIQNGLAVESPGSAGMYRDVWRKPVVYDEIKYEGDASYRWADLTGQEMVHRFWCGAIAGTYVGHGDYFNHQGNDTFTSFGGKLSGQSAPRLAFLKKILDEGPADGLDPIDKGYDVFTSGQAGEYYLTYFGKSKPTSWPIQVYMKGLTEGMHFKVDVIDTWNMTITPVDGEFVTKKKDKYYFVDANGRSITLPGTEGMAVRMVRTQGATGEKSAPTGD